MMPSLAVVRAYTLAPAGENRALGGRGDARLLLTGGIRHPVLSEGEKALAAGAATRTTVRRPVGIRSAPPTLRLVW